MFSGGKKITEFIIWQKKQTSSVMFGKKKKES
jgi:hypothetical protein